MIEPCLLRRQHAARGLLRVAEHRVEIDAEHLAPFLRRHLDRAHGRLRDAGIVDEDGDSAEGLLGGVEGAAHRGAVGDVGLDRHRLAAFAFDLVLERFEPVGAARHQRDGGAVVGERAGKLHAEPAGRAGDQRDAAFEVEQVPGFHDVTLYTREQAHE